MSKRAVYENYKRLVNQFSAIKTVSNFQQTGTLTPKEFVESGDAIVQKMPAWEWVGGDDKVQDFLPPGKKYLVLRGAQCFERAPVQDAPSNDQETDDGWVSTYADHVPRPAGAAAAAAAAPVEKAVNWSDEDDDAEAADDVQERPCRLYDVYVCYDKYYQSPRMFLIGFDDKDHARPLSKDEMMEDVYAANREKTVSIDPHPFLRTPCISIHPCRHAETMKRTIEHLRERLEDSQEDVPEAERVPFVFPAHLALFVFLKFISSVIPTIQYDVGTDLDM